MCIKTERMNSQPPQLEESPDSNSRAIYSEKSVFLTAKVKADISNEIHLVTKNISTAFGVLGFISLHK